MKLQIISALTFLFFMMLFSFVKLQITPTKYGPQISFGQELQPVATTPIIALEECYSTAVELKDQNNRAMLTVLKTSPDQQLQQLETIIEKLTTASIRQQHPGTVEVSENLPQ
jgi:hypothetical protein